MLFEYDQQKSVANKEKHGIDFIQAQQLWQDPECLVIPARTVNESRFLLISRLDKKIWPAIFTIREQKIRIISVRRAREDEQKIYQGGRF
jgi:uncharacterized DUF497 family protein